jgi:hypothetical protein
MNFELVDVYDTIELSAFLICFVEVANVRGGGLSGNQGDR